MLNLSPEQWAAIGLGLLTLLVIAVLVFGVTPRRDDDDDPPAHQGWKRGRHSALALLFAGAVAAQSPWSDPDSWPEKQIPQAGAHVVIPSGLTVALDTTTAQLGSLHIEGTLVASDASDVHLLADSIKVLDGGVLEIGSAAAPFTHRATITLTGERSTHTARSEDTGLDNDGVARGLMVMPGGSLLLFGAVPSRRVVPLGDHAASGATSLTLASAVDWKAGDRIAISKSDFYTVGATQILTLSADALGAAIRTTAPLEGPRWGKLQYPLDEPVEGSGMSLTQGTFTKPDPNTPTVLDERATVALLSRRIVIEGADDADWQTHGFGAHVMVMGLSSTARVQGVEFRRVGQRRAIARYPFHWHMLSYTPCDSSGAGGGTFLGDADPANHFLRDCAVWGSENRAVTIHGTCGVLVEQVVAVDVKGHAFFLEDGSERDNTITRCVAMKQRDPGAAGRIKDHDAEASGFWLTNPDNVVTFNRASDGSRGLWNSWAPECFGLSRNCGLVPDEIDVGVFDDNVGHSNRLQGIVTNFQVINEAGHTAENLYDPASGSFTMSRNQVWKNSTGGYANRVMGARYLNWTAADNNTRDFQGIAKSGGAILRGALLVGRSLNSATPFAEPRRNAVASYHYEIDVVDITAINYPFHGPAGPEPFVFGGGVFDSSDIYTHNVAISGLRNTGWKLVNSHAGYLTPPPYFDGYPLAYGSGGRFRYWGIAGAIWDPHGYWGPAGNYLIPDEPFFTHGLSSSVPVAPAGQTGLSTPHLFYGLGAIVRNQEDGYSGNSLIALRCARLDDTGAEVDEHTIGDPAQAYFLPNMRHFAVAKGGRYRITFPGTFVPTTHLSMWISNGYRADDDVLVGLPWSGAVPVAGRLDSGKGGHSEAQRIAAGTTRLFVHGVDLAAVLGDATGATIWQDTANDTVWFRHRGGLVVDTTEHEGLNDLAIAKPYIVRFRAGP
jgi:hypothetical protein